ANCRQIQFKKFGKADRLFFGQVFGAFEKGLCFMQDYAITGHKALQMLTVSASKARGSESSIEKSYFTGYNQS
ncbi:MAG: hypothetical protein M0041_03760, partial [Nitrospiraceae bacterium]|nr:hypothetical protein [Nitrospiraceae bacterium]